MLKLNAFKLDVKLLFCSGTSQQMGKFSLSGCHQMKAVWMPF